MKQVASQLSCQIKRLKVGKCGVAQQVALKRPSGAVKGGNRGQESSFGWNAGISWNVLMLLQ